jgi:hypothetical protein
VAGGRHRGLKVAHQRGRTAQQRRDRPTGGGLGHQRGGVQPGDQDALDGPVASVTTGQRPSAGRVQALGSVAVAQAQHPLGGAQVVQGVAGKQLCDQPGDRAAKLGGLPAAPGRGAFQEGDLFGRVVVPVGALAALAGAQVGLDQLPVAEHLDQPGGEASVDVVANQPPWNRVQRAGDLDVAVGMDLRRRPGRQLERGGRQRQQRWPLAGLKDLQRLGAAQRPAGAAAGDLEAPGLGGLLHGLEAGELAAGEEAIAHIGDRPLHARLILRLAGPGGVDEHAVVAGQLGIGAIQFGVVQVRADDTGLEVVGHQPPGRPTEEPQRRDVGLHPDSKRHRQHRADEQVPRAAQHHHKRPHPPPLAAGRVGPLTQVAVVQLGFLTRRRVGLAHRDHPAQRLPIGHRRPHIAAEAGDRHGKAALIPQPLVHRGHRVGLEHLADQLVVGRDLGELRMPQLGGVKLGEPLVHQLPPTAAG